MSGPRKWIRIAQVTLSGGGGGIVVGKDVPGGPEPLRILLDIQANISGAPNTGTVKIWNLSKNSRNSVGKEWDKIRVEAGYREAGTGVIGDGFIRDVEHIRDETDIITSIEFGDGDRAWREGSIMKTMDEGKTPKEIIEELHKNMPEVALGDFVGIDDLPASKRPTVLAGPVWREMNKLGRAHEFYWSIQCGTLEVIKRDKYINQEAIISPETGMVGVPTLTDTGIRVHTLMDPQIKPNRIVRVISETLEMNAGSAEGRFRVDSAHYAGNNKDGQFVVGVEGTRI